MNLLTILFLVNFLRTVIIILVVYYGIRLFTRFVLPLLVDKGLRNMQQKMEQQQRDYQRRRRHDGEVTIENPGKNTRSSSNDKGEYVDFEEVE